MKETAYTQFTLCPSPPILLVKISPSCVCCCQLISSSQGAFTKTNSHAFRLACHVTKFVDSDTEMFVFLRSVLSVNYPIFELQSNFIHHQMFWAVAKFSKHIIQNVSVPTFHSLSQFLSPTTSSLLLSENLNKSIIWKYQSCITLLLWKSCVDMLQVQSSTPSDCFMQCPVCTVIAEKTGVCHSWPCHEGV